MSEVTASGFKYVPEDPMVKYAWNLLPVNGSVGEINVQRAWAKGIYGTGVTIAFAGAYPLLHHPDIAGHFISHASIIAAYPKPQMTSLVGIAVATANNGVCSLGVAPMANFSIVANSEDVLGCSYIRQNGIYESEIYVLAYPSSPLSSLWADFQCRKILRDAAFLGRNGRGAIIIASSGSSSNYGDCNYNELRSSLFSIVVGSHGHDGLPVADSAPCASAIITAPGGTPEMPIVTSGIGINQCSEVSGTEVAAAHIAGVVALMLQANPFLSFWDVRHILIATASLVAASDRVQNRAGYFYTPAGGFGRVDASAAVHMASTYTGGLQRPFSYSVSQSTRIHIPEFESVSDEIEIEAPAGATVFGIVVKLILQHSYSGDLKISITSPSGTTDVLTRPRYYYHSDPTITSAESMLIVDESRNYVFNARALNDKAKKMINQKESFRLLYLEYGCCYRGCVVVPPHGAQPLVYIRTKASKAMCTLKAEILNLKDAGLDIDIVWTEGEHVLTDMNHIAQFDANTRLSRILKDKYITVAFYPPLVKTILSYPTEHEYVSVHAYGEPARGAWRLSLQDEIIYDSGILLGWSIDVHATISHNICSEDFSHCNVCPACCWDYLLVHHGACDECVAAECNVRAPPVCFPISNCTHCKECCREEFEANPTHCLPCVLDLCTP